MTDQEILNMYGFSHIDASKLPPKTVLRRKSITEIYKEYIDESEKSYSHYTTKSYWGYLGKVENQPIVEEKYLNELVDYINSKHKKSVKKFNSEL